MHYYRENKLIFPKEKSTQIVKTRLLHQHDIKAVVRVITAHTLCYVIFKQYTFFLAIAFPDKFSGTGKTSIEDKIKLKKPPAP